LNSINIDIEKELMSELKVLKRIKCPTCDKSLAPSSLRGHKTACENKNRTNSLSHRINLSMVTLKKRTEERDDLIEEAEKLLQQGLTSGQIIKKTGLNTADIHRISSGECFSIGNLSDDELRDKLKKSLTEKSNKTVLTPNEAKKAQSKRNRTCDVDTIISILEYKGKEGVKKIGEMHKQKSGQPVSRQTVGRILNGQTKLYPEDLEDKDMTYEDYLEIIEK
jgi:hypothetical protein